MPLLCHLIVTYMTRVRDIVSVDDETAHFMRHLSTVTFFSDRLGHTSGCQSVTTRGTTEEEEKKKRVRNNNNDAYNTVTNRWRLGCHYHCRRILYDRPGTRVYVGVDYSRSDDDDEEEQQQRRRCQIYTIKRYHVYHTACPVTSSDDDDDGYAVPFFLYSVMREIAILKYLSNVTYDENNSAAASTPHTYRPISTLEALYVDNSHLYLCMHSGATALSLYIRNATTMSVDLVVTRRIIGDMCRAIELCHENDILHGDVKPENFVVNGDGDVKLIDFGLSEAHFSCRALHDLQKQTLEYRAPELLLGNARYSLAVDIWALGCSVHEVLTMGFAQLFALGVGNELRSSERETLDGHYRQLTCLLSRLADDDDGMRYFDEDYAALQSASARQWCLYENYMQANQKTCPSMRHPSLASTYDPLYLTVISPVYHCFILACLRLDAARRPSARQLTNYVYSLTHACITEESIL